MRVLALSVVAAAGLSASVTAAADLKMGEAGPASQPNQWDVAFGVGFMNDYNWRGITVSARRPSVELYVEPRYRPAENLELYAGVSGANVDLPNGESSSCFSVARLHGRSRRGRSSPSGCGGSACSWRLPRTWLTSFSTAS